MMKVRASMMKGFNTRYVLTRAVAGAAALFIGLSPVTAYAYVDPEAEAEEVEEIVPPEEDPPVEEYGPLTPDGNMELVDDYGTLECGGKQFITVVTKSGNYFYIIIDRDDDGNENVHFLNMVDERDLLCLMEDEEVEEYLASITPEKEEPAPAPEPEPVVVEPEPKKHTDYTGLLVALPIMGIGAIAGYFVLRNKKKQPVQEEDPDADYIDEEDDYLNQYSDDEEEEGDE